ncbi:MAG: glycosyltransferase family 4 protein, partial [Rhizobiaceae bacterium]
PDNDRVKLVYHGLDLSRFPPPMGDSLLDEERDGSDMENPVRLITVGRAVAKKGIDNLLNALAKLPDALHWQWTHIGGGELHDSLVQQAKDLEIINHCNFLGSKSQQEVIAQYKASDIFVLPCRIDETGDRDGLPNVIVEAESQRLPVITTPISGIPELIRDDGNGVFVQPDDPDELCAAIKSLAKDPKRRKRLGQEGEKNVREDFDHLSTIGQLVDLLNNSLSKSRTS